MLDHMIRHHGKSKIAYIQGTENNLDAEERYAVYCEVLENNGLGYDPELVCPGDFTGLSVQSAVDMLIDQRKTEFDTLLAANDEMALAALKILKDKGIRVPENVAVIGFDNVDACRLSNPPLTTVKQPIYDMGYSSVAQLLSQIEGGEIKKVVLPSKTVIRKSCGCMETGIDSYDDQSNDTADNNHGVEKKAPFTTQKVVSGKEGATLLAASSN